MLTIKFKEKNMKKILVIVAGGFIGGYLVKKFLNLGYKVRTIDIKPFDEWYQCFKEFENFFHEYDA
jgi:hypothetical protein